jgi:hypothetical protein
MNRSDRRMVPAQLATVLVAALLLAIGLLPLTAEAQDWPDAFDPLQLLTLNLEMDPLDWETIQNDETFDIEVPAMFWADGEDSILVSVKRKSCDALGDTAAFLKVSVKIDINEYVGDQMWHGLKKLRLENGDDVDVVAEGLAWQLHRLASGPEGYDYEHPPAYTSWVKLNINGTYTGVYVNNEERDKQFLKNRGLYTSGETWLYKHDTRSIIELKVGDPDSPLFLALWYSPFCPDSTACPTPDPPTLAAELPQVIDVKAMLTMGAVNTFVQNPDGLWNHSQNAYFADFLGGRKRMYFPHDLDSVLARTFTQAYPAGDAYADSLLTISSFRAQYTLIMDDLLSGPLAEGGLVTLLDDMEILLTQALEADPNNQIPEGETVEDRFDELRSWVPDRIAEVLGQLDYTGVPDDPDGASALLLHRPMPNPTRGETHIEWAMPEEDHVRLDVFDVTGRLLTTLVNGTKEAGKHGATWEGVDRDGREVSAGVYFVRIEAGPRSACRKVVRLRR